MSKNHRILLGTCEIVRQLYELRGAFRKLGHVAESMVYHKEIFYRDLDYDHTLLPESPFPAWVQESANPAIRIPRGVVNRAHRMSRLAYFLTAFDTYVFQFGESLLPGNRDFPILKRLGKKIVCVFQGSDIRHWSGAQPVREMFGLRAYASYKDFGRPLDQVLRTLRMAERYADVLVFQPSYGEMAVRPYHHLHLAVDLSVYECAISEREVPVVVHAPSNRANKGTTEILQMLDTLKGEGLKFELQLLEGLPNAEVIRRLRDADIVVDELNEAHYGMLALEAFATGCAVAGGNHPGLVPIPPDRPGVHITPDIFLDRMRRLIGDRAYRVERARVGRDYVVAHHDAETVAKNLLTALDRPAERPCDYYPTFFAEKYRLPEGESIPDDLLRLTAEIVQTYGLPAEVDPTDMVRRGLLARSGVDLTAISRWNRETLGKTHSSGVVWY
jgi:hypothetical protein